MMNLHSASQALLNIYRWTKSADKEEEFFDKVRVFSFALNAQELSVRVHRATHHETTTLQYHLQNSTTRGVSASGEICERLRH
jgi:hypothetical protein